MLILLNVLHCGLVYSLYPSSYHIQWKRSCYFTIKYGKMYVFFASKNYKLLYNLKWNSKGFSQWGTAYDYNLCKLCFLFLLLVLCHIFCYFCSCLLDYFSVMCYLDGVLSLYVWPCTASRYEYWPWTGCLRSTLIHHVTF